MHRRNRLGAVFCIIAFLCLLGGLLDILFVEIWMVAILLALLLITMGFLCVWQMKLMGIYPFVVPVFLVLFAVELLILIVATVLDYLVL